MSGAAAEQVGGSGIAPRSRSRLVALDVFRGLTVAGMLLVNTPGSWSAIYAPLRHAPWHGWTMADLIFPFFLFVVGITTHISVASARAKGESDATIIARILRRGAIIFLLGLLVSAFPYVPLTRITEMRIPGVLQRIGVAFLLGALITLKGNWRVHVAALIAILLGYWYVMTGIPIPDQPPDASHLEPAGATMAAWVDRLMLNGHLWAATKTWDPEGILSTLPAVGSVILGVLAGRWMYGRKNASRSSRIVGLGVGGAAAIVIGLAWGTVFPINKNIWTSSYVLFAGGMGAVVLAICIWVVDVKGIKWWTRPFTIFGLNPLVAFVGSMVMARTIYSLIYVDYGGARIPLQAAIYKSAFASWLKPEMASLMFGVSFLLLWLAILALLERRNIVIKV
jgi:predicted acyltransferase